MKELNRRQVKQAEIFIEYYFKIKYVNGINNERVNAFNRKAELQGGEKPLGAILRLNKDKKVRYNYP